MNGTAHVSHRVAGRVRLRIADRRGDVDYFTQVARELSKIARVSRVECNPATCSVLLIHEGDDVFQILESAQQAGLFRLAPNGGRKTTMVQRAGTGLKELDSRVKTLTGGDLDIRSVILGGFVAMGVVQLSRGHIMGPAVTLFWYAYQLMAKSADAEKK